MNSSTGIIEMEAAEQAQDGAALTPDGFRQDVLLGLAQPKKTLPCKYLYDEQGAQLFEAICQLHEYYPTRTEVGILKKHIQEIAALLGPGANLIELGSGSATKTRLLLDHLDRPASYVPVDVARTQLLECSSRLAQRYPALEVQPVCADYTRDFTRPDSPPCSERTIFFFPGSTVGNFEPHEAASFLARIAKLCGPNGGLIIGVDLKKSPRVLNAAYNDARGVTAQFNLNLLARANRELDASFALAQFQHRAFYNETAGRIEMHLVSWLRQTARIDGQEFAFDEGESIRTEHSYKYSVDEFGARQSPAIEFTGVSKQFDSVVALEPTDLVLEAGKTTVLIGPSGCGKSTILRLIVGLMQPTTGQVRVGGRVVSRETVLELRRRMGYVIQEGGLFPHLTARDNVALITKHLGHPEEGMRLRLRELCELTHLPSTLLSRYPIELSGGQRQRVSLMRALMLEPDLLLLDEPLAALDPLVRAKLQTELKDIFKHLRLTVVLVTHELAEAAWLGDQIVLLRQGRIEQAGTFAELRDHPADDFVSDFINAQRNLMIA